MDGISVKMCIKYMQRKLKGQVSTPNPQNVVKNTKYNFFTFFPLFLYYQFKQPLNFFFLVITLSQFYPPLQVGFLFTYVTPLVIVLTITSVKEVVDDCQRWARDRELNNKQFTRLTAAGRVNISSANIKVGHIIEIASQERIPADMLLLSTADEKGDVYIKTDQLDGETDWKLRKAVALTQQIQPELELPLGNGVATVEHPHKNIYEFQGSFELTVHGESRKEGVGLENTLWANTTVTTGSCLGLVIYTGAETRSVMNTVEPRNKIGVTDSELNVLAMYLVGLMLLISLLTLALAGFNENSGVLLFRYTLLLSAIIPISLRVNLDFAKIYYCFNISRDTRVGKATARNSTIPEELGRIHALLSDKTGTLTKNEMMLKKLSLEFRAFTDGPGGDMGDFTNLIEENYQTYAEPAVYSDAARKKRNLDMLARDMITALAVCHSVATVEEKGHKVYQASSPDDLSLVEFTRKTGVELVHRDQTSLILSTVKGPEEYRIIETFPFTSARKRMGIIVQHTGSGKFLFYLKGADAVMGPLVASKDSFTFLQEECESLAKEGLRTLVVAQKLLSPEDLEHFRFEYEQAKSSMDANRNRRIEEVVETLEKDMDFVGVTGVEDKLQDNVDSAIDSLRSAGIKVWMITGDKVETAQCIAISTQIFKNKEHTWEFLINLTEPQALHRILEQILLRADKSKVLIVDGTTLELLLGEFARKFVEVSTRCGGVVCCRTSPTQKSKIVLVIQQFTELRVCAIGDGGNDVGMINCAHIGIGVEGKEGKQASMAADFAISEFQHLTPLILWHGRLSYQRTSKLANFIFHRGLIISVIQFLFFQMFYYAAIPIYNGYLMLGYTTFFTSAPVFSLVMDKDSDFDTVKRNANLYQKLQLGRNLNFLRFLVWIWKSVYQGCVIILLSIVLFPQNSMINLVAITFSALILTELLNIATIIQTWNKWIILCELLTFVVYAVFIVFLKDYFDLEFIIRPDFIGKVLMITMVAWVPVHLFTVLKRYLMPDEGTKLRRK